MAGRVHHAIDNAAAVSQAGDGSAGWLVPGPDRAGNLLEPVMPDPACGHPRDPDAGQVPAAALEGQARTGMNHRHRANGTPVTGVGIEATAGRPGGATPWTRCCTGGSAGGLRWDRGGLGRVGAA